MAFYVICLSKWNGKGAHVHKVIGVANDMKVAQELMVEKALHVAKWHGQLRNNELHVQDKFERNEQVLPIRDFKDHAASIVNSSMLN